MTLINSTLLFGLVLASVPVILHLVMRAKPKRIEFPALRLLKARQPSNARRMQLRHLLLLILRSLLIAVLVLAIARPSLPAASYGLRWWEWLTLTIVIVASAAVYFWMTRQLAGHSTQSVDAKERKGRLRLSCVLAGLAAALLAVGIPWGLRVQAELSSPRPETTENIPVAAVFLVDNSFSMKYRNENKTRLDHARTVIKEHLGRLPQNSRAAVSGLTPSEDIIFQADLTGAGSRLETLEFTAAPDSINRQVKSAIQTHIDDRKRVQEEAGIGGSADLFAREIYVFTDFSKTAWQESDESGIADLLKASDWLQVYVIDVGVPQPVNTSITGLQLSEETTVAGRDLVLSMTISATLGASASPTVETILVDRAGVETPFGAAQIVRIENGAAQIQTAIRVGSREPFIEGFVRLTTEDPLPDDNLRYFACGIRPRPRVLLISDRVEESKALRNVMQPEAEERLGTPRCECTRVASSQVSQQTFSNFDAIFLINCARPDDAVWNGLKSFAESGGGVFVVAGSNRIQPEAWNTIAAKELLPASPIRSVPFRSEPGRLQLTGLRHPILKDFTENEGLRAELGAVAFDRRWAVESADNATVLLSYTGPGAAPALLERRFGKGRCLLFTSAMDSLRSGGHDWNNFVSNITFFVLADKVLQHLTGANNTKLNFIAGDAVELPVPLSEKFEQFRLRRPGLRQTREIMPPEQSSILLTDAVDPGHYRVKPFESPSPFEAAFAVNFRDSETDLTRIPDETLLGVFGSDRVSVVHDIDELQRVVRVGRLGVEVFPVLMGLLILLFCAEHLMANFFYDEQPAEKAVAPTAAAG